MADDRRADHQYSVNRTLDAKRSVVVHPSSGRPYAGHTPPHMPQHHVVQQDGRRGTPTPPPHRDPSPNRAGGGGGGKPAAFHIQLQGSNDVTVIPVHIPVAGGQTVTALPRPASRGSPSAGAYVLHTGMVMPGGNMITLPATLATQRRTPSPKVHGTKLTRGVTPPPPQTVARSGMAMAAQPGTGLLAPPVGNNRNSSSSAGSSRGPSPMAQIPQLLITPAQAELLGCKLTQTAQGQDMAQAIVSQKLAAQLESQKLAAQLESQKLAAQLESQKLAAQLELNKIQQQQTAQSVAAAAAAATGVSVKSQKVLSSMPKTADLSSMAGNGQPQARPPSIPSAAAYPPESHQPPPHYSLATAASSSVPSSTSSIPHHKEGATVRRLPVNTEPQRFFASNTPTVIANSSDSAWASSSDRPQRPASHPGSKTSNLRQPHELTTRTVVPNGIDMTNANGDTHNKHLPHSDSRSRDPSPQNRQHTFVLQSQLTALRQQQHQLQHQQSHKAHPHSEAHPHRLVGKSHSELPRTLANRSTDSEASMPKLTPEKSLPLLISASKNGQPQQKMKHDEAARERLMYPFNMRVQNLNNFPSTQSTYRANNRSQAFAIHRAKSFQNAVQRARTGSITSAAKSLDLLRQNLQKHINQEIDIIIQRYMMYFKPGIENIRLNNGESTVTDDHVSAVCRQILEEAKKMYGDAGLTGPAEVKPEVDRSRSPSHSLRENQDVRAKKINLFNIPKRRGSSDSDVSIPKKKKKGRPPLYVSGSGRSTPSKTSKAQDSVKREGPKWDPDRLTESTTFIMGAKANKALGLGNTRGRLYIKHPDIFKYSGDQDDKQWLFEHQHMPATGGKAYMLLEEDIRELASTDEYRDNPGLLMDEVHGFSVPGWLIEKMKKQMQSMRSDAPKVVKHRSRSATPNPTQQEQGTMEVDPPLPFSTMSDQVKTDTTASPSHAETLELLAAADPEDADLQDVSPYNMTGGFVTLSPGPPSVSPVPSDLDALDDEVTTPFGTTD